MSKDKKDSNSETSRRDFLNMTGSAVGAVGVAACAVPFIQSMNPAADTLALATIEVDISKLEAGQGMTVTWQGKPVFIKRRTAQEIKEARNVDLKDLPDPEKDEDRVQKEEWLVAIGICTHLGCVPLGQKPTDVHGDFNGYFCPCHGSHYDTSGRIRRGPAPKNLAVPPYEFVNNTTIKIG